MDKQNFLAEAEVAHKPVKKKSTIVKLVFIGLALVLGMLIAFCPMRFGFWNYKPFMSNIKLGLDLEGGVYAVYQATETDTDNFASKLEGTRASLQALLVSKGYAEATVVIEGNDRIRVDVPSVEDTSDILKIIGEPAKVSFELTETQETVLTGDDVEGASAMYSPNDGGYVVSLELTPAGQDKFFNATSNNINKTMDIYVERGDERTKISSATINSAISGNAIISGNFTADSAQQLADQINSGTFDVALEQRQTDTISPTLGDNALKYGLIAGIVGFILVIAFMCAIYRMLGVGASISLLFYVVLYLFFLSVLPWVQLTLPGIAGILLSIGMAVDANIVIFERIKDEYRNGKSIMAAYHAGFKKALFSILDSNYRYSLRTAAFARHRLCERFCSHATCGRIDFAVYFARGVSRNNQVFPQLQFIQRQTLQSQTLQAVRRPRCGRYRCADTSGYGQGT